MIPQPVNALGAYLQVDFTLPSDMKAMRVAMEQRERQTSDQVNIREIGSYETVELLNGQQYFSTTAPNSPQIKRYVYRTVYDMVALNGGPIIAGGAAASVPHNISNIGQFTHIYGAATTTTPTYVPIPYASPTALNKAIELWADNTNVNVLNGAGQGNLTACYVVLEYIKS